MGDDSQTILFPSLVGGKTLQHDVTIISWIAVLFICGELASDTVNETE